MSLKNMLGFGKKSKNKDATEISTESVSLSFDMEKQNTFDSVSEASDGYNKPMTKMLEENHLENNNDMESLEELNSDIDNHKEMLSLDKTNHDIPIVKEDISFVSPKEKKSFSSMLGFKKKVKIEDEFTRPAEDEDISDKLSGGEKEKTASRTSGTSSSELSESSFEARQKKLPLIGKLAAARQYQIVSVISVLGALILTFAAFQYTKNEALQSDGQTQVLELKNNLQKFENNFSSATIGKIDAYDNMLKYYEIVDKNYKNIRDFDKYFSEAGTIAFSDVQKKLDSDFQTMKDNVEKVKSQSDLLKNSSERVGVIVGEANNLNSQVDRLAMIYLQLGANQNELTNIYLMRSLLQSIAFNAANLLLADEGNKETALKLALDRNSFKKYLSELYYGDAQRGINAISYGTPFNAYSKLANGWVHFADTIDTINKRSAELLLVREISPLNKKLVASMDKGLTEYGTLYSRYDFKNLGVAKNLLIAGLILILISLILVFYIYSFEKDNRALLEKIENNKNQTSILRLLNEMIPLQGGDLTAHATVTDEITGAIADSINSTVDSLGSLVRKIKDTSFLMKEKTSEVRVISLGMLKSSDDQAASIQGAAISVKDIANAIRDISEKTKKSAFAAEESTKVSEEGSKHVLDSVKSMQSIDGTMNETDRLMNKVQDSSKQISEIVELLSDITEETSILALNATVQAAKAGDAGKGFKIVADSIQELADSASDATRRVGALIAAVQTDIQAVSDSVGKTKLEVKNGVSLSESAGISLQKITEVSNRLSGIVREISQEAVVYAKNSDEISKNMETILNSTQVNKKSTEKTANSITEIADISNELGDSVQSFKVE